MRGRKPVSSIRNNIVELLAVMGASHGYEVSVHYNQIFPQVSQRVIYYHLKKGVDLELFKISKIEKEHGKFSWGPTAEKVYYSLGRRAAPSGSEKVVNHFAKQK